MQYLLSDSSVAFSASLMWSCVFGVMPYAYIANTNKVGGHTSHNVKKYCISFVFSVNQTAVPIMNDQLPLMRLRSFMAENNIKRCPVFIFLRACEFTSY